ncbi:hypothetical protein NFJ02_23g51350 [Pycnococcus provasolii]
MLYVIPVLVPIEAFTATMSELEQRLRERDDHARDAVILIRQRGIDVRESVAASLNVIAHVDDTSLPGINYAVCGRCARKACHVPRDRQLANSSSIAGPVALVELAKAVHGKLAMMV